MFIYAPPLLLPLPLSICICVSLRPFSLSLSLSLSLCLSQSSLKTLCSFLTSMSIPITIHSRILEVTISLLASPHTRTHAHTYELTQLIAYRDQSFDDCLGNFLSHLFVCVQFDSVRAYTQTLITLIFANLSHSHSTVLRNVLCVLFTKFLKFSHTHTHTQTLTVISTIPV